MKFILGLILGFLAGSVGLGFILVLIGAYVLPVIMN